MPTTRHIHLQGSIKPQGDLAITVHRRSPATVGGAIFGGTTGAAILGPLGALAGMVIGAVAGRTVDVRYRSDSDDRASGPRQTVMSAPET